MHEIRFRLAPLPGELTALPRPSSWNLSVLLLRGGWPGKVGKKKKRGRTGNSGVARI